MITKSESIKELATALAKAQSVIRSVIKASENPFFKSKYADLADVWDVAREPLTSNGLSVTQHPFAEGPKVTLVTMLMHTSGEWMSSPLTMTATKNDPQAIGSVITYARRYSLSAIAGISPDDDDDGNTATKGQRAPDGQNDDQRGEPFDPTNEKHKKALRDALLAKRVLGDHAQKVFEAMVGKYPNDLADVIESVMRPR